MGRCRGLVRRASPRPSRVRPPRAPPRGGACQAEQRIHPARRLHGAAWRVRVQPPSGHGPPRPLGGEVKPVRPRRYAAARPGAARLAGGGKPRPSPARGRRASVPPPRRLAPRRHRVGSRTEAPAGRARAGCDRGAARPKAAGPAPPRARPRTPAPPPSAGRAGPRRGRCGTRRHALRLVLPRGRSGFRGGVEGVGVIGVFGRVRFRAGASERCRRATGRPRRGCTGEQAEQPT